MRAARIRIGISGWRYAPWRKVFYPKGLAQSRELHYASRQLPTIEINGTFYSLQRPECFSAWRDDTPEDFVFAVKGSRYLTQPVVGVDAQARAPGDAPVVAPRHAIEIRHCYFDNDAKVHAPFDARRLIGLLEAPVSPGR